MLAAGALVGLLAGLASQALAGGVDPDIRGLVRVALLLPAGVFVAWWLLVPGIGVDSDEVVAEDRAAAPLDVETRVRQIEAAFDDTAVPRSSGHRIARPDPATRDALRRTIRRPAASGDAHRFGVRRA